MFNNNNNKFVERIKKQMEETKKLYEESKKQEEEQKKLDEEKSEEANRTGDSKKSSQGKTL